MNRHRIRLAPFAIAALLVVAGCATPPDDLPADVPDGPGAPAADAGTQLVGQGMVLQVGDNPPELCLGAIRESYPPQCDGIELVGWDWNAADGHETAGDSTFGMYAVWGMYNGDRFTVSDSVMLALYDPMADEDPKKDPDNPGPASPTELETMQATLHDIAPFFILWSAPENGRVFVGVVYDDGTLQEWADAQFGDDVIAIRSALKPAG